MFESLPIDGVLCLRPKRHDDPRGSFCETFVAPRFKAGGIDAVFIQDNEVRSTKRGVVRGFHFQAPPNAQAKLVRCAVGAIFDVAVDIRNGSPTFGQHVALELTAEGGEQVFIPPGFAHAYCTLTANTIVQYKVDALYARQSEGGFSWYDESLGIDWPVDANEAILSPKDNALPGFDALDSPFVL